MVSVTAMSELRIESVSIKSLARIIEAVSVRPDADIGRIAEFSTLSKPTTVRGLTSLLTLGLIKRELDGQYTCANSNVKRGLSYEAACQIIRHALVAFRPFEAICEGLAVGEPLTVATRRACALLHIDNAQRKRLDILIRWAIDLGIISKTCAGEIIISPEIDTRVDSELMSLTKEDVQSEAKARLTVARLMGRAAFNFLDEMERGLFTEALMMTSSDPALSVEKTGQAIENLLRTVASLNGLLHEASRLTGAAQVANLLVSHGLIHTHQQKMVETVSTLRNAKVHHRDRRTLLPWEITETASLSSLMMALTVVRSIFEFTINGRQTI